MFFHISLLFSRPIWHLFNEITGLFLQKKKKKATNLVVTYITQYIFIYLLLNVNFDKLTIRLHFFYIIYVYKISKKSSINNYVIHQLF